ncbi:alpha/beta hydrolase family protein [Caulobacter sp. KR2-114]|uniref:alpha/beta hydrolase family protein n=1 Tax=Caulobacter sp. KR2-114 TaxID=3400912 RepID=UPI003C02C7F9
MRIAAALLALSACLITAPGLAAAAPISAAVAIAQDPPADAAHPARMEVIHVPTGGGLKVNGIVYVAAGPGPHPTLLLFHGLPGNERNLDLAQAVRRAGWNVVAINYRGSWGSPGAFSFAQNLEDARAALAFARDPANAGPLQIDTGRIAIAGHSMGGWVTAETLAVEPGLLGGLTISAGDMGAIGQLARRDRAKAVALMADNRESLNASAEAMADEAAAHADDWGFAALAPKLKDRRLQVLYSDDFVKADSEGLVAAVKAAGGTQVTSAHAPTDHSWSDHRIALETLVIDWLNDLPGAP